MSNVDIAKISCWELVEGDQLIIRIECHLDSPVVFPERDAELGAALLAEVSLAPLGLGAQRVQQAEEQLLRRNLQRHFRNSVG